MARRTFRLLKDTIDLKKGTIFQEKCDDGDQVYIVLDIKNSMLYDDWKKYWSNPTYGISRDAVELQPEWFEEVFAPTDAEWITAKEVELWKDFQAGKSFVTKAAAKAKHTYNPKGDTKTKYPYLHTMEVGDVKHIQTASRARVNASAINHGKSTGKKFSFKKLNNYSTELTRIK